MKARLLAFVAAVLLLAVPSAGGASESGGIDPVPACAFAGPDGVLHDMPCSEMPW